jgi:exodeoxyribonuclease VII small subunit
MTYEESLKQLEDIVRKMEAGDYSIDELAEKLTLAQQLITQCKDKLSKSDTEIKKILEKS